MDTINLNSRIFSNSIKNVFTKIVDSLVRPDISDDSTIVIDKILRDPEDERLFNEAVEYLKQHKEVKEKEISLSNNELLTISIE